MTLPFTSVVSYHTNPMTCGVAKFSAELARRLDVPFLPFAEWSRTESPLYGGAFPLLSLKWSEVSEPWRVADHFWIRRPYAVFWHDAGIDWLTEDAAYVFYADPSLGSPGLWCPSLITPRKRPVRLFSFGMAHKLQTDKYQRVRELLDAASIRYHLRVSVGLHEGTSLDGAEKHFDALKAIMGEEHVTILGILSDDAVSEELANCDYVLAFFEKGLRANNTTVHAALAAEREVVTNWGEGTPEPLQRMTRNIDHMPGVWNAVRWIEPQRYSWKNLIEAMRKECENSRSRIA